MADEHTRVRGLPELKTALLGIAPKLRRRALRNALAAGARVVRDAARQATPVLRQTHRRAPFRTPGTVRKAISVRTSKIARRAGDVGVFVNVKPAPKGQRGARSATDPFYWRFLEFGTKKMAARPFLKVGASRLNQALDKFISAIRPAIDKLNRKELP
jgi:HK97 gp10 family phage protein